MLAGLVMKNKLDSRELFRRVRAEGLCFWLTGMARVSMGVLIGALARPAGRASATMESVGY